MILRRFTIACLASIVATISPAGGTENAASQAFAQLKTLIGTWQGENGDGEKTAKIYRLVANGTVLQEEYDVEGRDDRSMTTMYHLDGDRLLLTHYCVANNQPRMQADLSAGDSSTLRFEFRDATNLASPEDGHMHRAVIDFVDHSHMAQAWTFQRDGKEAFTETVRYERID